VKNSHLSEVDFVACGSCHTLCLDYSANVWSYGRITTFDILDGLGRREDDATPVYIPKQIPGLTNITSVHCGSNHSLCIEDNSFVWTFGMNGKGQLGLGDTKERSQPCKIPDFENIISAAGGMYHSLFVDKDGNVFGCGSNEHGQLGIGDFQKEVHVPIQVEELFDIISVDCGNHLSAALNSYGNAYLFGKKRNSIPLWCPSLVSMLENLVDRICCAAAHVMVIDLTGDVWAWGNNDNGQLGVAGLYVAEPTLVEGISNAIDICTSSSHTIVKTDHGELFSFGLNASGALGIGNTCNKNRPTKIPDEYSAILSYTIPQFKSAKR